MPSAPATGGNGEARRWEGYALKILSGLLGILSILFWDMRREQVELRRISDQRIEAVSKLKEHDTWIQEHRVLVQQWAVRLALMEKQLLAVEARANTHANILQRLSQYDRDDFPER